MFLFGSQKGYWHQAPGGEEGISRGDKKRLLFSTSLQELQSFDLKCLAGGSSDGAFLAGHRVKTRLQETAPQCLVLTHCVAHRLLSLASSDACKDTSLVSRFEWIHWHIYCQKYNTCCWASRAAQVLNWNWNRFLKHMGYPMRVQWIICDRVQGNTIEEEACYYTWVSCFHIATLNLLCVEQIIDRVLPALQVLKKSTLQGGRLLDPDRNWLSCRV